MGLGYKPDFYLTANDKDITDVIKKSLISLTLTDNSNEDIDQLVISLLLSSDVKTPPKGAELALGLGFETGVTFKGKFIVDEISASGPPRLITIIANAAPLTKKSAIQSEKTKSFDEMSLTELVDEISAKHKLKPKVSAGLGVLRLEHIDQTNESDMSLLARLAHKNNAVVAVKNENLLFIKKDEGKSVTGKPLPVITLKPEQCSSWQCTISSRGEAKKVTAEYTDVETGKVKEITVGSGEPERRVAFPLSSEAEARAAIESMMDSGEAGSSTLSISMPASPENLHMVAEGKVKLNGFGDIEDQEWTIRSLEWSLSNSGFTLRVAADIGAKPKVEIKPVSFS